MKQFIIITLLSILWVVELKSQNYEPCAPYKTDRTLSEFKQVLGKNDAYHFELRKMFIQSIKEQLQESKIDSIRNYVVDEKSLGKIIDNAILVSPDFVDPDEWWNCGHVSGTTNKFLWVNLKGQPSKWVVWPVGDLNVVLGKVSCLNPARKKVITFYQPKLNPNPTSADPVKLVSNTTQQQKCSCSVKKLVSNGSNGGTQTVQLPYGYNQQLLNPYFMYSGVPQNGPSSMNAPYDFYSRGGGSGPLPTMNSPYSYYYSFPVGSGVNVGGQNLQGVYYLQEEFYEYLCGETPPCNNEALEIPEPQQQQAPPQQEVKRGVPGWVWALLAGLGLGWLIWSNSGSNQVPTNGGPVTPGGSGGPVTPGGTGSGPVTPGGF